MRNDTQKALNMLHEENIDRETEGKTFPKSLKKK
jgi:hypothetical protein